MRGETATATTVKLPPAYRLVVLDRAESSSDEAMRLAKSGAEDGTLVWIKEQTKGRGRRGRSWTDLPGNLTFSLVLRPETTPAEAAQLSLVAALGVGDGLGSVVPPMVEIRYKWPNDVLFNDRKGCGILLEAQLSGDRDLDWLVLGIGINVKSYPRDLDPPATSLHFEGAPPDLGPEAVLEAFSRHFLSWTNRWLEDGFAPIRTAWLRHAKGVGEPIEVRLPGETLEGVFKDLDPNGALRLELPGGETRSVTAGDVFFGGRSA